MNSYEKRKKRQHISLVLLSSQKGVKRRKKFSIFSNPRNFYKYDTRAQNVTCFKNFSIKNGFFNNQSSEPQNSSSYGCLYTLREWGNQNENISTWTLNDAFLMNKSYMKDIHVSIGQILFISFFDVNFRAPISLARDKKITLIN